MISILSHQKCWEACSIIPCCPWELAWLRGSASNDLGRPGGDLGEATRDGGEVDEGRLGWDDKDHDDKKGEDGAHWGPQWGWRRHGIFHSISGKHTMTNSGALRTSVILSLLCMIVVFNIITVLPQAHETSSSMQLKSIAEVASCLYNRALGGEPREGTAQAAVVRRSRGRARGSEFDSITVITVTVIITPG